LEKEKQFSAEPKDPVNQDSKLPSPPSSATEHNLEVLQTPFITPTISANLHNKNKRKGFKQSMQGQVSQRTVFGEKSRDNFPYFVPPSEREDIPSNILVTSVDVEEGMWERPRRSAKANGEVQPNSHDITVALPYGKLEESLVNGETAAPLGDLEDLEKRWATLPVIEKDTIIEEGNLPGCKVSSCTLHACPPIDS